MPSGILSSCREAAKDILFVYGCTKQGRIKSEKCSCKYREHLHTVYFPSLVNHSKGAGSFLEFRVFLKPSEFANIAILSEYFMVSESRQNHYCPSNF